MSVPCAISAIPVRAPVSGFADALRTPYVRGWAAPGPLGPPAAYEPAGRDGRRRTDDGSHPPRRRAVTPLSEAPTVFPTLHAATRRALHAAPAAILVALLAACAAPGRPEAEAPAPPLLTGLGSHHHEITTRDTLAQRYFDQGLRLAYAFNHAEAERAFLHAATLDPRCAMCYWGVALVRGPNINAPMDSASGAAAYAAVREAQSRARGASEQERAYIQAMAARYAATPVADRAKLDSAYATAMADVARRYPSDPDAATLYAEAVMTTSPWEYWTADGAPKPSTTRILAALEGVLARTPDHPGACHFFIHAVEAAHPERAVPCAERLAALMPAAGHIVHMPAHIYIRTGRYADAIEANVHAVHADESYITDQKPQGFYPMAYYPHNYHFLAFAATLAGRGQTAVDAARGAAEKTPPEVARLAPELQLLPPYPHLTLATFGRWDEVLREPLPASDLRVATGLAHYARGRAQLATGKLDEAAASLDTVQRTAAEVTSGSTSVVLRIATHALRGELASRRGDGEGAVAEYERAQALEDGLSYMEPPYWHAPIRHLHGAALLRVGRAADAERLYREDLRRFPENGWSLFGLSQSLAAQGRKQEAAAAKARFARAFGGADVTLVASHL